MPLAIYRYIDYSRIMEEEISLAALAALGQETRLRAFRLLVEHEPDGLPAGEIADRLDVQQNTLSTHLGILVTSGLARSRRDGRSVIYRAELETMNALMAYLTENCCRGGSCADPEFQVSRQDERQ